MRIDLKVADAVWVATALLQRDAPKAAFSVSEIIARVEKDALTAKPRQTIYQHANQHCVANRPPNDARLRMLVETAEGQRRLFHQGDAFHPLRANARILPNQEDLPDELRPLVDWYRQWDQSNAASWEDTDPLMRLYGSGQHLWADEHADAYIQRLRQGWE